MSDPVTRPSQSERIGPGALVLIVGPSGAGKDTLLSLARSRLAGTRRIVFARRVVTRPSSMWEEHDTLTPEAFDAAEQEGGFCLSWRAHGLGYGLPAALVDDICAGRVVVANVSRSVVPVARESFKRVLCIAITAPAEVLAERLAGRTRGESVGDRLARAGALPLAALADAVIENVGAPALAGEALVDLLQKIAWPQNDASQDSLSALS